MRNRFNCVARGFTLLEVLVAVAIFALIGIMAMGGYSELSRQSERVTESMKRLHDVQLAITRITQDFAELEPRPVRDPLGSNFEPALLVDGRSQVMVQLTRAGWSNPAGIQRSSLQRVTYRFENGKLYRAYWPVLDRTLATQPIETELLDHVRGTRLRFMDRNRMWSDQWPPVNQFTSTPQVSAVGAVNPALSDRPLAVEVALELEDWGMIVRLIEVPG